MSDVSGEEGMSKFLRKYVRKLHRWLAIPSVALILVLLLTRSTPLGYTTQRFQQIMMLSMAITGLYLLVLPWWTKRRRHERKTQ
jgi:ABC-type tungstate transport system substrate-binding protein